MKIAILLALFFSLTSHAKCPRASGEELCLGIKAAIFNDTRAVPVATEEKIVESLKIANRFWSSCSIAFELVETSSADGFDQSLKYNPENESDMYVNYERFKASDSILLVFSGPFVGRQSHSTGYASYPWRPIPGAATLPKTRYNTDPHNIAHELGHVLGFNFHHKSKNHVMYGEIGKKNVGLEPKDCPTARKHAETTFKAALR